MILAQLLFAYQKIFRISLFIFNNSERLPRIKFSHQNRIIPCRINIAIFTPNLNNVPRMWYSISSPGYINAWNSRTTRQQCKCLSIPFTNCFFPDQCSICSKRQFAWFLFIDISFSFIAKRFIYRAIIITSLYNIIMNCTQTLFSRFVFLKNPF